MTLDLYDTREWVLFSSSFHRSFLKLNLFPLLPTPPHLLITPLTKKNSHKKLKKVAGDEESFTAFKDLFDIVIEKRNGGFGADAVHPTDLDIEKVSKTKIDPDGKYVLTTRCRTGRSVRGLPLPPACSFEQRRETERVIVKGLNNLEGELKGKYFPLHGSQSMEGKGRFGGFLGGVFVTV